MINKITLQQPDNEKSSSYRIFLITYTKIYVKNKIKFLC